MLNKMNTIDVKVIVRYNHLKIYLDDVLHISIQIDDIVGIQSYLIGTDYYHIDYYTKTTTIDCRYTRKDIWISILKELDKISLI